MNKNTQSLQQRVIRNTGVKKFSISLEKQLHRDLLRAAAAAGYEYLSPFVAFLIRRGLALDPALREHPEK